MIAHTEWLYKISVELEQPVPLVQYRGLGRIASIACRAYCLINIPPVSFFFFVVLGGWGGGGGRRLVILNRFLLCLYRESSTSVLYIHCLFTMLHRALQTSPREGYAGTALLFHPTVDVHQSRAHFEALEKPFREACCGIDDLTDYCDLFFERRIIDTGEDYVPPSVGKLVTSSQPTCFTLLNCRARIRRPPLHNFRWTILYTEWIWRVHFDGISICGW